MDKDDLFYEGRGSKIKGVLLIFAIIIVVVGIGLAVSGILLLTKPKMIMAESFNYLTGVAKELNLEQTSQLNSDELNKIKFDGDININFDESLGLGISNIDLDLQVLDDINNKTSKLYLDSKIDSQDLIEFISYFTDDKMYFTFTDIFDKYYYMDADYSSIYEDINEEDIKSLIDIVKNSFDKVVTDESFEKERTTTSVDGIKEDVTRLTLKVDDILLSELSNEIIGGIKNDEGVLNLLSKISDLSKEELIEQLDEALEELNDTTGETLFTYNIYYRYVNDVRKLEVLDGTTVVTYTANDDSYRFKVTEDGFEQFSLSITDNENDYSVTIKTLSTTLDGTLVKNNNGYNLDLNISENGENLGTLVINYLLTSTTQDKIVVIYKKDNVDLVKVTIDSKVTFDEEMVLPDFSTSKSIDDITELESQDIITNLQNHQIIGPFINMFLGTGNGENTNFNYQIGFGNMNQI